MNDGEGSILVLGGTGYYGRHVVKSLLAKEESVRVLSRNAAGAQALLGEGVQVVQGDIAAQDAVEKALAGVKAVVVSISALNAKQIRKLRTIELDAMLQVFAAVERIGVPRLVYISVYEPRTDLVSGSEFVIAEIKKEVETALANSALNWTVLGAAPSMEIFFFMLRGNTMMVPGGGPPALPTVSPVDVGEIAAQAVLRSDLAGQRFRMCGPEALSFPEAAERIAAVWGRPIRYFGFPLLPLRIVSNLLRPFNPFLYHMYGAAWLMNHFPAEIVAELPGDHQRLRDTFDYTPSTLEMEAQRRQPSGSA